ncbi:MAG: tRNA1(Val) (adenine(37)-N6)-methyltransferase [Syntrophales bacterium]|nr:tRNA1(Val) (adenine(37)-N6)-methyltransferase [Syntrophales bacterium]
MEESITIRPTRQNVAGDRLKGSPLTPLKGETVDGILGGQLKIIQKEKGYRFSLDALLLAHFVCLKEREHVLDMGAGSGIISLILARQWGRWEYGKIVGVEIQEELVDMARRSVGMNNLEDKVSIRQGDIREIETFFASQSFDVVIFNPPYRGLNSGRINPDYQKAVARHEIKGSLNDFLRAAGYVLKESGRVYTIYPAIRMVELLFQMRTNRLEPKKLRLVHANCFSKGEFILVEGIKGAGEELEILPPLVIYEENGRYSEAMSCLFKDVSAFP